MRILALDHSGETVSAALALDEEVHELVAPRHEGGESLLAFLSTLLRRAGVDGSELDLLVVGIGPGSYTGIRVALGLAQGLATAWRRPLLGASAAEALALQVASGQSWSGRVLVALDAGLGESATLVYDPRHVPAQDDHHLLGLAELVHWGDTQRVPFLAAGSGLPSACPPTWRQCRGYLPGARVTARDYLLLASSPLSRASPRAPSQVTPLYLRPAVGPRRA